MAPGRAHRVSPGSGWNVARLASPNHPPCSRTPNSAGRTAVQVIAALIYSSFAPFHYTRLEAAARAGVERGDGVAGVEIASSQRDYQWPKPHGCAGRSRPRTLFSGRDFWSVPYWSVRSALREALDELQPDVVVLPGWSGRAAAAGLGWCIRNRVPRVLISESQEIDRPQTRVRLWVKRQLLAQYQAALAAGRPHVRFLNYLGLPSDRCSVSCSVVDNGLFARAGRSRRDSPVAAEPQAALLSCLRLLPRKNVLGVLEVLAKRPTWTWTIAGYGPQRRRIERRIYELGLHERVRLLGPVDYFELPGLYPQFDAYLQPSLSEPWGLAVNEAMASGLPVLVSDRCGCREDLVAEGANGFIFDPRRQAGLANALDRLLGKRRRWSEMGRASQEIVADWGPELFARGFWEACQVALQTPVERSAGRLFGRVLERVL